MLGGGEQSVEETVWDRHVLKRLGNSLIVELCPLVTPADLCILLDPIGQLRKLHLPQIVAGRTTGINQFADLSIVHWSHLTGRLAVPVTTTGFLRGVSGDWFRASLLRDPASRLRRWHFARANRLITVPIGISNPAAMSLYDAWSK
jgi:hypothetical protein